MTGSTKTYDYFVSYSHADRSLVSRLAALLRQKDVRIWWDTWEMRPGDLLRETIDRGIDNATHYLVVVSSASLQSSWVRHELDGAFIRSIENSSVRLIPAIGPGIEHKDLPLVLRQRLAMDLRTRESLEDSAGKLADLVQPQKRVRRELKERLRSPHENGIGAQDLLRYATTGTEQDVQIAALRGSVKLQNAEGVCIVTARSLRDWGVGVIEVAIDCLGQLTKCGGLLALSATLMFDNRFVGYRLTIMKKAAEKYGRQDALTSIEEASQLYGPHFNVTAWAQPLLNTLSESRDEDIRFGAYLMRAQALCAGWLGPARIASAGVHVDVIKAYFESRVPGLLNTILRET